MSNEVKRTNMACEYANDGKRITEPGKFEGCPIFAPYYWGLALDGFSDADDGVIFTFKFRFDDARKINGGQDEAFNAELREWLGRKRTLRMLEDSQGFVHCF